MLIYIKLIKKSFRILITLSVSLLLFINVTYSADNPKAIISIISNLDSINKNADLIVGIRFKLPKGWTTYWRSPGDVGYGARFNWEGSKNIKNITLFWPYPIREKTYDFSANVYENEVLFPVKIIPKNESKPISIQLSIDYLLCQPGACIPLHQNLSWVLPVGNAKPGKNFALINKAMEKIPKSENTDKLFVNDLRITQLTDDSATLRLNVNSLEDLSKSSVFIEGPEELTFDIPKLSIINDKSAYYTINVKKNNIEDTKLAMGELLKKPLLITLVNNSEAISVPRTAMLSIEKKLISMQQVNSSPDFGFNIAQDQEQSIISMLFFAFLGGLILNLMPCVFPILSLKILTLRTVEHKTLQGIFYTLGVMISFVVIALIIITLQHVGNLVGWGFQMQSPIFLISLIFLFTLISLNLFGFYEIPFSLKVTPKWQRPHQLLYSFCTGVLACVVSTPCTAPFMATAIGVAFYKGSWGAILIFLMLGFGFALPYLLFCIIPGARSLLPRPGPWMEQLKQFLGFPMLLSVIWLLWVAGYQLNYDSIIMLLVSLCFLVFFFWLLRTVKSKRARMISVFTGLFLVIYPLYWISQQTNTLVQQMNTYQYNSEQLQNLLNQKRKVFVYATAAWCITCKMNESIAINTKEVQDFFKQHHIVVMKADWTNKNDAILRYLQSFNRAGVPLYVYYPGSGKAIVLPQILTRSVLINALNKS